MKSIFSKIKLLQFLSIFFMAGLISCTNEVTSDNTTGLSGFTFPDAASVSSTFSSNMYYYNGNRLASINTSYLEGWEDIPFLDLEGLSTFISLTNERGSQYDFDIETSLGTYKYDPDYVKFNYDASIKDDTLYFDLKNQKIYSDDFLRIITATGALTENIAGGICVPRSGSDTSANIVLNNTNNPTTTFKEKSRVSINLGDYGLKMFYIGDKLYIPFQVVADFFFQTIVVAYNGKDYYVAFSTTDDSTCTLRAWEGGRISASDERSQIKAEYNYRTLCMLFDLNYCLKDQRSQFGKSNITYFNDSIFEAGLGFDLLSTNTDTYDKAFAKFLLGLIDDGHTGYNEPSLYQNESEISYYKSYGDNCRGKRVSNLIAIRNQLGQARTDAGGKQGVFYVSENDTKKLAVICFDGFIEYSSTSTPPSDLNELAKLGTYPFLLQAFDDIAKYSSTVKNVVIDLSCNGGGSLNQCLTGLSFLKNPDDFYMATRNHLDGSVRKFTYTVTKKDGSSLTQNYNFYVLTSGFSFSCGNYFPAICKYQLGIPIVGKQSGGGGGVVKNVHTSDGALFQTSAAIEMCEIKDGQIVTIDSGVPVDLEIDYENFYSGDSLYQNLYEKLKEGYPEKFE